MRSRGLVQSFINAFSQSLVQSVTEFGQEMKTKAQKQNAHTRTAAAAVYWYSEGHVVVLFGFLKRNHAKT